MDRKASRNTIQRDLVFNAVKSLYHPTADEVYSKILTQSPSISKATVYRNLHLLAEMNLISEVNLPGEADRFDAVLQKHYHAICRKCGRIIDVDADSVDENILTGLIKNLDDIGFTVENYDFYLSGICNDCKDCHES